MKKLLLFAIIVIASIWSLYSAIVVGDLKIAPGSYEIMKNDTMRQLPERLKIDIDRNSIVYRSWLKLFAPQIELKA